eukprot:scaffold13447_cov59-Attheya_sp.AAC.2
MHKSLCENAAAVTSNLGDGNHGHLALLMTDEDYLEETKQTFNHAPKKPGDDPPTALKSKDQPFVNDHYKQNQRVYEKYRNINKALKKQIEATMKEAFISTLRHELTRFNQVTVLQMVTHLYTTNGDIEKSTSKTTK